jgi:hypothetical protein
MINLTMCSTRTNTGRTNGSSCCTAKMIDHQPVVLDVRNPALFPLHK